MIKTASDKKIFLVYLFRVKKLLREFYLVLGIYFGYQNNNEIDLMCYLEIIWRFSCNVQLAQNNADETLSSPDLRK